MKSKKVFVVKNFKSPYIEEAIFILREDTPAASQALPDAVSEAERIIAGYLDGLDAPRLPQKQKSSRVFATALGLVAIICALVLLL
ncbi:MAG: hypothetical protein IJN25_07195 [Clostridia bacterium]|nr:hypothetical protein [Oscillospiraceae bacterium]MBQ7033425.1 hypothetical protein [Clostridia bacterium]